MAIINTLLYVNDRVLVSNSDDDIQIVSITHKTTLHDTTKPASMNIQPTDHELIPQGIRILRQCKVPRAEVMFITI
jgi:hypothetical protein